jgi:hypothetical protein
MPTPDSWRECVRCGLWMRHTHPCVGSTLSEPEETDDEEKEDDD